MSKKLKFAAEKRERAGKGVARALRRENRIPAVIYGDHKEPVAISLSAREVNKEYNKGHMFTHLTELSVDGEKHLVLARDVQLDPVMDFALHVDFLRVSPKTTISVNIPVHFINEEQAPGLEDNGGILNIVRHEIELNCRATHIPEQIEVDLTGKDLGDAVRISDVTLPEGTSPTITDRDFTIATIVAPRAQAAEDESEPEEEGSEEAAAADGAAGADDAGEAASEE